MITSGKSVQQERQEVMSHGFVEACQEESISYPKHYTEHPSGIECIQITEHMNFCLGNAIKYIWRADIKGNKEEDLKKAIWYIERELQRIK